MNAKRIRLINAARKAFFQRARLQRSADNARQNFMPQALKSRATAKLVRQTDAVLEQGEAALRKYSLPLGLAAVAGLAVAFRRPLADLADRAVGMLHSAPPPTTSASEEHDDEPV